MTTSTTSQPHTADRPEIPPPAGTLTSNFAKGAAHGPEFPRTACGVLTVRLYRMFPPTSFAHKLIISTLSVPQPAMRQDVGLQPNLSRNHRENALGPENPRRYAASDRD